jgi:hypothetical protein
MGSRASTPAPASSGMEIKYGAPTAMANRYATPTRANPYLTSSQYSDMQQHTPSGYYYQGGKFYEPYTVGTKTVATGSGSNSGGWRIGNSPFGLYSPPTYSTVPDIKEGSVQSGSQYFKPFAGNAQGIINGNLSMAASSGQNTYQPQAMANLFAGLLAPSETTQQGGVGRFTGTPSKT